MKKYIFTFLIIGGVVLIIISRSNDILLYVLPGYRCHLNPDETPKEMHYYERFNNLTIPYYPTNQISEKEAISDGNYYLAKKDDSGRVLEFWKVSAGRRVMGFLADYTKDGFIPITYASMWEGNTTGTLLYMTYRPYSNGVNRMLTYKNDPVSRNEYLFGSSVKYKDFAAKPEVFLDGTSLTLEVNIYTPPDFYEIVVTHQGKDIYFSATYKYTGKKDIRSWHMKEINIEERELSSMRFFWYEADTQLISEIQCSKANTRK